MDSDIKQLLSDFDAACANAQTLPEIDNVSVEFLGRKGRINSLFTQLKESKTHDMRTIGDAINACKKDIQKALDIRRAEIAQNVATQNWYDPTLPGVDIPRGRLHMVTQAIRDIRHIFHGLGFIHMSYPEVEWEHYAFDALNMPKIHPARDDFETFFIDKPPHAEYGKMLLTPHTSNGQVREMQRVMREHGSPPVKMINISRTYRPNWDATHTPMFHQFEGLCIDKCITIAHLKGAIEHFAKEFFGRDRKIRLRPYDFLFTEPSFEVDIHTGTDTIGRAGWLELGGAGMVHPHVLKEGGIDPEQYTGWAFGFGIERVAMMRGGVSLDDLRVMYSGDVRFLEQF